MNITLEQLGQKLNTSRQSVKGLEKREILGTISLNSLREVANVLDLQLVYGLVPKDGSFDDLVEKQAEKMARKIVLRTHQNMKLEAQQISDKDTLKAIKELTYELKKEMNKSLWD